MKLPGEAWLDFGSRPAPTGAAGWPSTPASPPGACGAASTGTSMLPFHGLIFPRMARAIVAAAEERNRGAAPDPVTAVDERDARPA